MVVVVVPHQLQLFHPTRGSRVMNDFNASARITALTHITNHDTRIVGVSDRIHVQRSYG